MLRDAHRSQHALEPAARPVNLFAAPRARQIEAIEMRHFRVATVGNGNG